MISSCRIETNNRKAQDELSKIYTCISGVYMSLFADWRCMYVYMHTKQPTLPYRTIPYTHVVWWDAKPWRASRHQRAQDRPPSLYFCLATDQPWAWRSPFVAAFEGHWLWIKGSIEGFHMFIYIYICIHVSVYKGFLYIGVFQGGLKVSTMGIFDGLGSC